jgi:hypothetical protein
VDVSDTKLRCTPSSSSLCVPRGRQVFRTTGETKSGDLPVGGSVREELLATPEGDLKNIDRQQQKL